MTVSSATWAARSTMTVSSVGSAINNDGGSDREILIRLGKANSAFGRLGRIWASKNISVKVKVRLYEALILAVLLYGAETWPMKQATTKKLEAAHHRWLRKILRISWKDKVTNEKVRALSQQGKLEAVIRERRLRWTGHVMRMEPNRIAKAAVHWIPRMVNEGKADLVLTGYRR